MEQRRQRRTLVESSTNARKPKTSLTQEGPNINKRGRANGENTGPRQELESTPPQWCPQEGHNVVDAATTGSR